MQQNQQKSIFPHPQCMDWLSWLSWLSWIDDCLVAGDKRAVEAAKEKMKSRFECDDLGELNEYV
jgi:hypothetical protein